MVYPNRRGTGRMNPTSVLLTACLSAVLTDAARLPYPTLKSTNLVVVPRDPSSATRVQAASGCATYQGQVGSSTFADLYLVDDADEQCFSESGLTGAYETHYRLPAATKSKGVREVGLLFWLRPDTIEIAPEQADYSSDSGGSAQVVLSGESVKSSRKESIEDLLASLDPTLAPGHVLDLPNAEVEGALVSLSIHDAATRLVQLEYLSTHPLLSDYSLIAVPLSLESPNAVVNDPFPAVPPKSIERVKAHLDHLSFQPTLSAVLKGLEGAKAEDRIRRDVQVLSGEDQSSLSRKEKWVSRHSMSQGGFRASNWVHAQMSSYGFNCTQLPFLTGFAPMVECVYRDSGMGEDDDDLAGSSRLELRADETVVLGAHFDSRGSFGYPTAPGADDDASGTSLVLAVARHIWQHRLRFSRKLVLALYAGEEQGLLSSSFYAQRQRAANEDVVFMLQVDMVGYRKPGEPMQLARPDLIGLPEAGWFVGNVSSLYAPELVVGYTPACCSDHQSYVAQGYPATWIFERNGPIADPCYHNSCDLSKREGYSFEQIAAHTRVAFATVWEVTGGRLP